MTGRRRRDESRLYKGGDRKNDRIPILFTISVLLGAMSATGYSASHSLDCGKIRRDRFTRRLRDAMNRVFTRDCCFHISLMFWLEEVFFFPTLHLSLSLVDAKLDKKLGRSCFRRNGKVSNSNQSRKHDSFDKLNLVSSNLTWQLLKKINYL